MSIHVCPVILTEITLFTFFIKSSPFLGKTRKAENSVL